MEFIRLAHEAKEYIGPKPPTNDSNTAYICDIDCLLDIVKLSRPDLFIRYGFLTVSSSNYYYYESLKRHETEGTNTCSISSKSAVAMLHGSMQTAIDLADEFSTEIYNTVSCLLLPLQDHESSMEQQEQQRLLLFVTECERSGNFPSISEGMKQYIFNRLHPDEPITLEGRGWEWNQGRRNLVKGIEMIKWSFKCLICKQLSLRFSVPVYTKNIECAMQIEWLAASIKQRQKSQVFAVGKNYAFLMLTNHVDGLLDVSYSGSNTILWKRRLFEVLGLKTTEGEKAFVAYYLWSLRRADKNGQRWQKIVAQSTDYKQSEEINLLRHKFENPKKLLDVNQIKIKQSKSKYY